MKYFLYTYKMAITEALIKKPRKLTEYNMFVKNAYQLPEIQAISHKERLAAIAVLWRAEKAAKAAAKAGK
jgi:hypothetical protein